MLLGFAFLRSFFIIKVILPLQQWSDLDDVSRNSPAASLFFSFVIESFQLLITFKFEALSVCTSPTRAECHSSLQREHRHSQKEKNEWNPVTGRPNLLHPLVASINSVYKNYERHQWQRQLWQSPTPTSNKSNSLSAMQNKLSSCVVAECHELKTRWKTELKTPVSQ